MTGPMQVLAIGETMVLVHPLAAERLESAIEFRLDVGGAESNVASHLVALGVPAAWAGAVGADALGRRLLDTLRSREVDTGLVLVDPGAPTGVYFKDPGAGVLYYRGGSAASRLDACFAATLPLDTVPWVHVSGITAAISSAGRALLDRVFDVRRDAGLPVSFDVNHRPALWGERAADGELLALARRSDLILVGADEAERLWGAMPLEQLRDLMLADRPSGTCLVVKDGGVGATAFVAGQRGRWFAAAPTVDVVEPVGAGDAFAAGFLAARIQGSGPDAALRAGHAAAGAVLASMSDYAVRPVHS